MTRTIDQIIAELAEVEGSLLPVLHAIQEAYGYIDEKAVPVIAEGLNLSRAEVHGVISFYADFRTQATGKHLIQVCRAEACQAMGSRDLEQYVKNKLLIDYGQTSSDGAFTLEPVYCLGNCACSPTIRIDDRIYARIDKDKFDRLLHQLERQQEHSV